MSNYVFYSPSNSIGGQQLLFCRVAEYLFQQGYDVIYYDYKDGFSHRYLSDYSLEKKVVDNNQIFLDTESILIVPLSYLDIVKAKFDLSSNPKVYFWSISPVNIFGYFRSSKLSNLIGPNLAYNLISVFYYRKLNRIEKEIDKLNKLGRIWFMDYSNYKHSQNFLKHNAPIEYVPIPVPLPNPNSSDIKEEKKHGDQIDIAWLGRISKDYKLKAIFTLVEFIERSYYKDRICFHIIGDGDSEDVLLSYLKSRSIRYHIHGRLDSSELDELFTKTIDILFAMGTSALEGGVRSIPTVIIDPTNRILNISKYKFRWLYEVKSYSLGFTDLELAYSFGRYGFDEIIELILSDSLIHSKKCFNYVLDNHSIEEIGNLVIARTSEC